MSLLCLVGKAGKGSVRNLDGTAETHSRENLQHQHQHRHQHHQPLATYCRLVCRHWYGGWFGTCCSNFRRTCRPHQATKNNRRRGEFLDSPDHRDVQPATKTPLQPVTVNQPARRPDGQTSTVLCSSRLSLKREHLPWWSRFWWRLPPPAARAAPALPCAALSFLFLTEQPHTYVIPTTPKTTCAGCCPSRQVDPAPVFRLPAAIAVLQGLAYLPT